MTGMRFPHALIIGAIYWVDSGRVESPYRASLAYFAK